MSTTRVKRSRPVAKRAKAPAKRRNRIATKSRVDAFFAALPVSPATMQRMINLSVAGDRRGDGAGHRRDRQSA
jgi:cell division protein FtsQ